MNRIRALILGSDRRIYRLIRRLAERAGFESRCVTGLDSFQAGYVEFRPHCIFLDLDLAGIDFSEVLRYLASQHAVAMVIVMGAATEVEDQSIQTLGESLGLNMQGTLGNEFNIDDIKAKLQAIRQAHDAPGSG